VTNGEYVEIVSLNEFMGWLSDEGFNPVGSSIEDRRKLLNRWLAHRRRETRAWLIAKISRDKKEFGVSGGKAGRS
jgi:hypothetical protein